VSGWEVVITFPMPFDVLVNGKWVSAEDREMVLPFVSRESAEGARDEITVDVRRIRPGTIKGEVLDDIPDMRAALAGPMEDPDGPRGDPGQ
jgi:hypothetical protein